MVYRTVQGGFVFTLTTMLMIGAAMGDPVPGDEDIQGAVQIDITPEGFAAMGDLVPGLAPEDLPVEDISEGYPGLWDQCYLGGAEVDILQVRRLVVER